MRSIHWKPLQFAGQFDYDHQQLKENWTRLHKSQSEPFPDADTLRDLCDRYPSARQSLPNFNGDYHELSAKLLDAWAAFHRGDFEKAWNEGLSLGYIGYLVAHMATCVYAGNVTEEKQVLKEIYLNSAQQSLEASKAMPDHINSTYFYGLHLGRYSETVSLLRAAKENIAPKFTKALEKTLKANPNHLLATVGMGTFHASVVDTVGSLAARITYGATKEKSLKHFEHAMSIAPELPVVYIEYSKGIKIIEGKKGIKKSRAMLEQASQLEALDAMEALDVAFCVKQLENL